MKTLWKVCLLGVLAVSGAAWSQAKHDDSATEKAVAGLENEWLKSQQTNNADLLLPLLADNFIAADEGKAMNKAELIAAAKKRKYTSADYEDVKVTVFGNTAIASGGFLGKGTDAAGKPFDDHDLWIDTWVKMPNGKWLCVASADTAVKKK
jgi:ketosteroid isomerase-like protein